MKTEHKEPIELLCGEIVNNNQIDPHFYDKFHVKRGLRNEDGTGVVAGLTNICNVHGYLLNEGEKQPMEGELIYRGYNIADIVQNVQRENRFGYEEIIYLLLLGELPNQIQLENFQRIIATRRELPEGFAEDMIIKAPSSNIMNKLARSVLALYSYDGDAEDQSIEKEIAKSISLIARLPAIMVNAYRVKRRIYDKDSLIMHQLRPEETTAQSILSTLRPDRNYTDEEAKLLDLCLMLHAEHGGGNNSTFVCRAVTSSGTDTYASYSAAISSLKGRRHGGANIKVAQMLEEMKENVADWENDGQVADYLRKIIRKEAGDGTGLIYGMGHAVYTLSDPRAKILKSSAMKMAKGTEIEREFHLLDAIERLTPLVFEEEKHDKKIMCANVDLYSGLVYQMLKIPQELYTPMFAISRMAGWSAHRIEELLTGGRIIRPAYKAIAKERVYTPLCER